MWMPTCGDIGRHEHLNLTVLYAAQRSFALGLGPVTVQWHRGNAALFELARQTVGAVLRTGENQCALVLFDDVRGELGTLFARDLPEVVVDVTGRFVAHDVVDGGVVRELFDEGLDVRPHRGREQHDVAVAIGGTNDAPHAREKAHVGHAVGFVDDHGRD